MPQVIPVHVALRSRLRESVEYALMLDARLESLIAVKSGQPSERFHGKVDHSQPPWNAQVADMVLGFRQLARELEAWLRVSQQLPAKLRGSSDGNTRKALEGVIRLAENADDLTVKRLTKDVDRWVRSARVVLGETELPKRLPRRPGQAEPKCPFCEHHTLRMRPLEGVVFCIFPDCRDDDDRKPSARMEFSAHAGDWVMVWQDGIAGVPA